MCFVCAILYTCGVHSFTAISWQQARNCVPYVQSPFTGITMPVTCYIFIVLVHKLVTLKRCCSPLLGNHLFSVQLIQAPAINTK